MENINQNRPSFPSYSISGLSNDCCCPMEIATKLVRKRMTMDFIFKSGNH